MSEIRPALGYTHWLDALDMTVPPPPLYTEPVTAVPLTEGQPHLLSRPSPSSALHHVTGAALGGRHSLSPTLAVVLRSKHTFLFVSITKTREKRKGVNWKRIILEKDYL